ncbi:MAG: adenylate kinase family protein [Candidatus Methylacidiphilales bacterium]
MKPSKTRAYYFIGPPASGKGTHGKLLGGLPGYLHFSMGQAFRALRPGTEEERREMEAVHELTSKGYLADDGITLRVFDDYLQGLMATRAFRPSEQILILDGMPRRRSQAQWLADRMEVLRVIEFVCDRHTILDRVRHRAVQEGRADDSVEVVETRLKVYDEELGPLMDFFPPGMVARVDSSGSALSVLKSILAELDS